MNIEPRLKNLLSVLILFQLRIDVGEEADFGRSSHSIRHHPKDLRRDRAHEHQGRSKTDLAEYLQQHSRVVEQDVGEYEYWDQDDRIGVWVVGVNLNV